MSTLDDQMRNGQRRRNWLLLCVCGLPMLLILLAVFLWEAPVDRSKRLTQRAEQLASTGDYRAALALADQAAQLDPENVDAIAVAAASSEAVGSYAEAIQRFDKLIAVESPLRLSATLQKARILHEQLLDFLHAEAAYRSALQLDPDNVDAHTGLIRLLAVCARRREAIPFILELSRNGVMTDTVVLLSSESGIIANLEMLTRAHAAFPDDPNPLVGMAWHYAEADDPNAAIDSLERAIRLSPDFLPAQVALGPLLLRSGRLQQTQQWQATLPATADQLPEPWLVRAQIAEQSGSSEEATRCYWEAARIAPELRQPMSRLAQLLAHLGQSAAAQRFAEASQEQQELHDLQIRVINQGNFSEPRFAIELIEAYERQGRLFEACGWSRLAAERFPESQKIRTLLTRLENDVRSIPLVQTVPSANLAAEIDLSGYPLPDFRKEPATGGETQPSAADASLAVDTRNRIRFRDDAQACGLNFQFFNGASVTPTGKIFELTGGGIGVLDFDGDAFPDVFLTQGKAWPFETPDVEHSDQLFQNLDGEAVRNITNDSCLSDDLFSQGVAAGDVNVDGFSDVYIANIGENRLWLNNGDGTFDRSVEISSIDQERWTTSCAIADLDGDALPDLLDVNYLSGDDLLERVCPDQNGRRRACLPVYFDAAPNRVLWNLADGRLACESSHTLANVAFGKGLGVAIWYVEGTSQPRILIANDTTPNQLLAATSDQRGSQTFDDLGFGAGIALNKDGKAEGCMGIAVADLDADGLNEFLVTNFLNESNTLFWQTETDFFDDRTHDTQLYAPSIDVLGFGTQFLDADLDGLPELFVANGHVDDLRDAGKPYRMPAQLFRWNQKQFELEDAAKLGPYFEGEWLGRSVARIDWNRDGLNDLLVGHLDDEYSLLTNETTTSGHFISLKLIGVESNRDAIGTTVRVASNRRNQFQQLMAGDGFQCSNERQLIFGTGAAEQAQTLDVVWPSGRRQQFRDIIASRSYLLVEGGEMLLAP